MDEDATAEDNKRENNLASGCYKTLNVYDNDEEEDNDNQYNFDDENLKTTKVHGLSLASRVTRSQCKHYH